MSIRLTQCLLLVAIVSCESRNPAAVWEKRNGRASTAPAREEVNPREEPAAGEAGASAPGDQVSASREGDAADADGSAGNGDSDVRRVLAGGVDAVPAPSPSRGLRRLDLALALRSGEVSVAVNDPTLEGQTGPLFDGDADSLVRSERVNPLFLTFRFASPVAVKGVRVFPSYSSYDFGIQTSAEGEWLVLRGVAGEAWSGIELGQPVETAFVRLEFLRRQRDDFVHLNEVELWMAP